MATTETPRLLNTTETAKRLGLSASFLAKARMVPGSGPPHIRVGTRVLYDAADLDSWVEAQKEGGAAASTDQAGEQ